MGLGDEIMATGHARLAQRADPRPVVVLDRHGRPRWCDLWDGNPRLARTAAPGTQTIVNAGGCRPYIDYARTVPDRWAFTEWRAEPGELPWCRPDLRGSGAIIVEPHLKAQASPNKQWRWDRWQDLVARRPDLPWAQVGPAGTRTLAGVRLIATDGFRQACAVLAAARGAVLPEGGLHHAAAALGVPAVVLFGAYVRPANTGYDAHRNIWIDDPDALGWRVPHPACAAAWDRITVDLVAQHLDALLTENPN